MRFRFSRPLALFALAAGFALAASAYRTRADDKKPTAAESPTFTAEQVAFFEKDVLPVLTKHCLKCHGAEEKVKGELYLTTRKGILDGGDHRPGRGPQEPRGQSAPDRD